jgi:hypothetical protein
LACSNWLAWLCRLYRRSIKWPNCSLLCKCQHWISSTIFLYLTIHQLQFRFSMYLHFWMEIKLNDWSIWEMMRLNEWIINVYTAQKHFLIKVHVVWSENSKPYKRDTIATRFCDILIVLYVVSPLLLRVHIEVQDQRIQFGPLFDGSFYLKKIFQNILKLIH